MGITCDIGSKTSLGKLRDWEVLPNKQNAQYIIHYLIVLGMKTADASLSSIGFTKKHGLH